MTGRQLLAMVFGSGLGFCRDGVPSVGGCTMGIIVPLYYSCISFCFASSVCLFACLYVWQFDFLNMHGFVLLCIPFFLLSFALFI